MKKLLLSAAVLAALGDSAFAQLNENFNNGIPSTWKRYNVDGLTPATQVAYVNNAWVARVKPNGSSTSDSCIVSTSWYSPVGTSDDWIVSPPFMVSNVNTLLKFEELGIDPQFPDGYEVRVFTGTDSLPSQNSTVIYSTTGAGSAWNYKTANLGAYNGQTIRVAFRNNSNDKFLLALDNISTITLANQDEVSVDSVIVADVVGSTATLQALVKNQGYGNITSVTLTYMIDNGAPVSQTFSGMNLAPLSQSLLTFSPVNMAAAAPGAHTLTVTAVQVNGMTDPTPADNEKMANVVRASGTVARAGLIEEFTSSTCAPCAAFNQTFDPLIVSNNANTPAARFNVIKYQMNWPSPGTDPSYNGDGIIRRGFYGVNSIPDHYTNGMPGANGNQAEINASKADSAFVNIDNATYIVKGDSMFVDFSVTPMYSLANATNYRVYAAVVERQYNYTGTTSQRNFVYVMRKMFPTGNGAAVTSFTDGIANNYSYTHKFTVGGVAQGNNNLWGNAANTDLVVFVQDTSSGAILQSASFPAQVAQSVANTMSNGTSVVLFPNPAVGTAYVNFTSDKGGNVNILVTDAVGRVVVSKNATVQTGRDVVEIATDQIPAGVYNVSVKMNGEVLTQRLSIVK